MAVSMNMNVNVDNEDMLEFSIKENTKVKNNKAMIKIHLAQALTDDLPGSVDFLASGKLDGTTLNTDITINIDGGKDIKLSFKTGFDTTDKTAFLEFGHGQRQWAKQYNIP